jgi:ATP-dependent helicase/nuclease subunit B
VVLPGLDTELDADAWRMIAGDGPASRMRRRGAEASEGAPGHPQFALNALLARIGIERHAVMPLAKPCGRERLVSEALRPAAATELWQEHAGDLVFAADAEAALASMAMIEAANADDEALAIAVALRQAVEEEKTAALVTPDRALARRVNAALRRWNIEAEDSGGDALAETPAGIFARRAAETALGGLAPVTLLALLKHPLLRLGLRDTGRAVAALERAVLRGPRPRRGSAGLSSFHHAAQKIPPQGSSRSARLRSTHLVDRWRTFGRGRSRFPPGCSACPARKPRTRSPPAERHGGTPSRGAGGVVVRWAQRARLRWSGR